MVSLADFFWLTGYLFFAVHFFITLKFMRFVVNPKIVIGASTVSIIFLTYAVIHCLSESEFKTFDYRLSFAVNIAYPILDSILMVPRCNIFNFTEGLSEFISTASCILVSTCECH